MNGVRSHIYTTDFVGEKTNKVQMYTDHLGYVFLSDGVLKRVKQRCCSPLALSTTDAPGGPPLLGLLDKLPTYAPPNTVQQGREQLVRLSAVGQCSGK